MTKSSFSPDSFREAVGFMRRMHRGEKQLNGLSTARHVMNVTKIIADVLARTNEGTAAQRRALELAALGHDLLEGTGADEKDVRALFGARAFRIIWGMTDERDKKKPRKYAEKVGKSGETVRLLKLADHVDNYTNAVCRLPRIGQQRVRRRILPILEPMRNVLFRSRFRMYPKSAAELKERVAVLAESLNRAVQYGH